MDAAAPIDSQTDPYAGVGTPVGQPLAGAGAGSPDPYADVGTPVGASPAAATAATQSPSLLQRAENFGDNLIAPQVDTTKGLIKGGMHTVAGLLNILADQRQSVQSDQAAAGLRPQPTAGDAIAGHVRDAATWLNDHAQDHGIWQHIGDFGESALELMSPEALAGLVGDTSGAAKIAKGVEGGAEISGKAQQMADAAKVAKTLDQYPRIKALMMIGAKAAAKAGLEVSGQTYVKTGGDTGAAIQAGEVGAALGGAVPLVGGAVGALRGAEATRQAVTAAHEAAPEVLAQRAAAEGAARQAAAQQGVKDVAARATGDAFQRFNAGMASVPGFAEAQAPAAPKTFGEGAEALKEAVRPLYQRADAVTGYNGKLQELMAQHGEALKNFDYKAADKAEIAIDDLLETRPADVTQAEQAAMRLGWRDAKVLDKVHAATEGAFNGISEDMAAQPGTGTRLLKSGSKEGGALQRNLGKVLDTPAKAKEAYRVLGRDGVANLYRASNLVSTPEMAKATAALAEQVAKEFPAPVAESKLPQVVGATVGGTAGSIAGHAIAGPIGGAAGFTTGAAAGAYLSEGARDVMRKMVMSPRVGQLIDFAVRNNVAPKVAAGAIAAEIRREQGEQPK